MKKTNEEFSCYIEIPNTGLSGASQPGAYVSLNTEIEIISEIKVKYAN